MSRGRKLLELRPLLHRSALALLSVAAFVACDALSSPTIRKPSGLVIVTGDRQRAPLGAVLPEPVVVKVVDALGRPVGGQPVEFRVVAGGGTVDPATARTDAGGLAGARWTLGAESPGEQRLNARASSFVTGDALPEISFTASAQGPAAANVVELAGGGQAGQVGSALTDSLAVKVTDASGRPVADQPVSWAVLDGDGSVNPTSTRTNAAGVARTRWQLGGANGLHRATATVNGLPRVVFVANALLGTAAITKNFDNQAAAAGSVLPRPLVVTVRLADGRPVVGVRVYWVPATGNVDPSESVTDAAGVAQTNWRLGGTAGTQTLRAVVIGIQEVTFTAIATP